jgi:hypothetical protein
MGIPGFDKRAANDLVVAYKGQAGGRFEPPHVGCYGPQKKVKIVLAIFSVVYILVIVDSGQRGLGDGVWVLGAEPAVLADGHRAALAVRVCSLTY